MSMGMGLKYGMVKRFIHADKIKKMEKEQKRKKLTNKLFSSFARVPL